MGFSDRGSVDSYWRSKRWKRSREDGTRGSANMERMQCATIACLSNPYDAEYHKKNGIKHLSYHAYINKLVPNKSTVPTSLTIRGASSSTAFVLPCQKSLSDRKARALARRHLHGLSTFRNYTTATTVRMVDHLDLHLMKWSTDSCRPGERRGRTVRVAHRAL